MILLFAATAFALTLDEAWDRALTDGPDAAIVRAQADATSTIRGVAVSALMPRVTLSGGYTWNQYESTFDLSRILPESLQAAVGDTQPFVINAKEYWSATGTVIQPLFSGSALPAYRAADATRKAAQAGAEQGLANVRIGVATAYWGALAARQRAALAEQNVERAERYLKLAEAREQIGSARPTATLQARAALARAQRERGEAIAAKREAEGNLSRLVGVDADVPLSAPAPRTLPWSGVDEAVQAASGSPSLRVAEYRADAARATANATHLGWVPSINGRFTETYSENTGFTGEKWVWQAAVTADWTFDGGARIARETEAAKNHYVADRNLEREREQIEADVRTLWERYTAAQASQALAREELGFADKSLQIAEAAYGVGNLTDLELADARAGRDGAALAVIAADMAADLVALALLARAGVDPGA